MKQNVADIGVLQTHEDLVEKAKNFVPTLRARGVRQKNFGEFRKIS